MTREQIEQMPAGKELDALIAQHIFNARRIEPEQIEMITAIVYQFSGRWHQGDNWVETLLIRNRPIKNPHTGLDFEFIQPYDYSSRIDSAWVVVGEMKLLGFRLHLQDRGKSHLAEFRDKYERGPFAKGDTPMLAICRAALIGALNERDQIERGLRK
ncbi:MAG: hypothetical protein L0220_31640 [Acidobacteria bacterium]|nr:hypothetical protein [Acidobacteriota bacterium]